MYGFSIKILNNFEWKHTTKTVHPDIMSHFTSCQFFVCPFPSTHISNVLVARSCANKRRS